MPVSKEERESVDAQLRPLLEEVELVVSVLNFPIFETFTETTIAKVRFYQL